MTALPRPPYQTLKAFQQELLDGRISLDLLRAVSGCTDSLPAAVAEKARMPIGTSYQQAVETLQERAAKAAAAA